MYVRRTTFIWSARQSTLDYISVCKYLSDIDKNYHCLSLEYAVVWKAETQTIKTTKPDFHAKT